MSREDMNKLADWMIQFGFATGHGDTMEQLLDALGTEIVERIECEIEAEREACARVCEEPGWNAANWCAKAIRARGEKHV